MEEMDPSVLQTETGRRFGTERVFEDYARRERGSTAHVRLIEGTPGAAEFTEPADAPERAISDPRDIVTGSRVEHQLFGSGKVIAIEGTGDQTRATVFFKRVGQKKLVLKFAKLKIIG